MISISVEWNDACYLCFTQNQDFEFVYKILRFWKYSCCTTKITSGDKFGVHALVRWACWHCHQFCDIALADIDRRSLFSKIFWNRSIKSAFRRFLIRITRQGSKLNSFVKSIILGHFWGGTTDKLQIFGKNFKMTAICKMRLAFWKKSAELGRFLFCTLLFLFSV